MFRHVKILRFLFTNYSEIAAAEESVYYNAATSYPSGSAGAISSSMTLLVPSDADSTTTQQV